MRCKVLNSVLLMPKVECSFDQKSLLPGDENKQIKHQSGRIKIFLCQPEASLIIFLIHLEEPIITFQEILNIFLKNVLFKVSVLKFTCRLSVLMIFIWSSFHAIYVLLGLIYSNIFFLRFRFDWQPIFEQGNE